MTRLHDGFEGLVSTVGVIFAAVCLKALLTPWLRRRGWWPDWEKRGERLQEHKRVIDAYEEWKARRPTDRIR